jgi:hypothetical protein
LEERARYVDALTAAGVSASFAIDSSVQAGDCIVVRRDPKATTVEWT